MPITAKRLLLSLLLALMLLATPLVVAADTWSYYLEFTVSDNSSTDWTALPIVTGISAQNLIDAGYLDSSGNITNMKEGSYERDYGVATDNITLFIPSLLANQSRTYRFYMNYLPAVAHKIIVGVDGYFTISDNASLELGDNFTIEQKGWIDTNSTNDIVFKRDAFHIITDSGNITAGIISGYTTTIGDILYPESDNSTAIPNINPGSPVTHFDKVDDSKNSPDDDTTYVKSNGNITTYTDIYNLTDTTGSGYITSVVVCIRVKEAGGDGVSAATKIVVDGTTYTASKTPTASYTTFSESYSTNPKTGEEWTWAELDALKAGVSVTGHDYTPTYVYCTQVFVVVNVVDEYTYSADVTATGVSSGEHTVKTEADGTLLGMGVDTGVGIDLPITDGLVLNLPLHHTDMTGSSLTSKDSNEHTCTVNGTLWKPNGRYFDGTDDRIMCGNVAQFQFERTDPFSLECWFRTADAGLQVLMSKHRVTGSALGYQAVINNGGILLSLMNGDNRCYISGGSGLDDDVFHHLVCTLSGSGVASGSHIYVDSTHQTPTVIDDDLGANTILNTEEFQISGREGNNDLLTGYVGEVRIYDRVLTDTEIQQNYNATKWRYDGTVSGDTSSDTYFQYVLAASVPDNTNDWIVNYNSTMPYLNYYKHYVGGNLVAHYEPTSMISGTTLPDRSGEGNNATITWGSNPAGIEVDVSSITSYQDTTATTAGISGISHKFDEAAEPEGWFVTGTYGGTLTPELLETFGNAASDIGMPEQSLWLIIWFGVSVAIGLSVMLFTGSILIALMVTIAGLWAGVNANVIDFGLVFLVMVLGLGTFYLAKQH